MDWMMIVSGGMFFVSGFLLFRTRKMKKKIYIFAEQLEQTMDAVLAGREAERRYEMEDTLIGRISEKFARVCHIWDRKKEEEKAEKEKMKELIADISHQTKTPIANQKIYLEILRGEELPERVVEFLAKLEHQTDKLEFLFQSMVKMSRIETGIIQIKKKDQDIAKTVQSAAAAVSCRAAEKRIRIYQKGILEIQVPHDRKWTEEAVGNLLDNAVKYTDAGGTIHVFTVRGEIYTEIHVKDSGKGIAKERQAQIFTRFYREPEVHDQDGVGIGLYLTRTIAELQDGYVEVCSEPGKGSDFRICLPNQQGNAHSAVII